MAKYRICENKYGYCKIQERRKKFFRRGYKWEDVYRFRIFENKREAHEAILRLIKGNRENNKEWVCSGEYNV